MKKRINEKQWDALRSNNDLRIEGFDCSVGDKVMFTYSKFELEQMAVCSNRFDYGKGIVTVFNRI